MNSQRLIELNIEIEYKDGIPCQLNSPIKYKLSNGMIFLFNDWNKLRSVGSVVVEVTERVYEKLIELEKEWTECSLEELEDPLKQVIYKELLYLEDSIKKLYRLLRWMYFFKGADNNIQEIRMCWKITKENKILSSSPKFPRTELVWLIGFDQNDFERNLEMISKLGDDEPVQHSIIRDAFEIVNSNPKNSLLLAIIALEVGVKDFIAKSIPSVAWIVFNIQTPPVDKILSDYLYTIDPKIILKDEQLKVIKLMIKQRNELSHRGTFSIDLEKLHEGLDLIKDILYLFDYLRGHKWAIHKLNTLKAEDFISEKPDAG